MVAQPVCQGSPVEVGEDGAPIGGAVQEGETREGGAAATSLEARLAAADRRDAGENSVE